MFEYCAVQIPDEMDETFLLPTVYRIVRRIEICDQDAREIFEQLLDRVALSRWCEEISDVLPAS